MGNRVGADPCVRPPMGARTGAPLDSQERKAPDLRLKSRQARKTGGGIQIKKATPKSRLRQYILRRYRLINGVVTAGNNLQDTILIDCPRINGGVIIELGLGRNQ